MIPQSTPPPLPHPMHMLFPILTRVVSYHKTYGVIDFWISHSNYRPQTKLRKGNVFTNVCQEFCIREEVYTHTLPPWADHPPPHLGRRLLQRTAPILLESILIFFLCSTDITGDPFFYGHHRICGFLFLSLWLSGPEMKCSEFWSYENIMRFPTIIQNSLRYNVSFLNRLPFILLQYPLFCHTLSICTGKMCASYMLNIFFFAWKLLCMHARFSPFLLFDHTQNRKDGI